MRFLQSIRRRFDEPGSGDVHVDDVMGGKKKLKKDDEEGDDVKNKKTSLASLAGRPDVEGDQKFLLFMQIPEAMRKSAAEGAAPEWIPILPSPGSFTHPAYGEIEITRERNQGFVDGVNNQVYQDRLPVDAEHQLSLSGAYAWMDQARVNADGSVDGHIEKWLPNGKAFVESGAFRYTSAEWREQWQHPSTKVVHSDVLIGAALTTRPFFKNTGGGPGLRAIVCNEKGIQVQADVVETDEHTSVFFEAFTSNGTTKGEEETVKPQRLHEPDKGAGSGGTEDKPQVVSMTDFQALKALVEGQVSTITTMGETITQQTGVITQLTEQNKTLIGQVATQHGEAQTKRFTDLVIGAPGTAFEGLRWFGDPAKHVATLKALSGLEGGEESEAFKSYVESNRAAAEAIKLSGALNPAGLAHATGTAAGPVQDLKAAADAIRAKEPALTPEAAMARAATENPALYQKHREEHDRLSRRA